MAFIRLCVPAAACARAEHSPGGYVRRVAMFAGWLYIFAYWCPCPCPIPIVGGERHGPGISLRAAMPRTIVPSFVSFPNALKCDH